MKYAHYEKRSQKLLGWYDPKIHTEIPIQNIEVSDEQWQIAIDGNHNKVNMDGTTELFDFRTNEEKEADALKLQAIEASKARDEAMLTGFVYGTNPDGSERRISVTKDDGDGMVQVKVSFELGLPSTVIHFANGTKLPMTAEEFPAFALQFVTERGKFFS